MILKKSFYLKQIFIIPIIGIIVFFNVFFNGFVWDDYETILRNLDIHTFNIPKLFGTNIFTNESYYRPISATYFTLLYGLVSTHALFYHLIQVSLHIFFTVLLFKTFKYFFSENVGFLLALIFLVHPINVESVAYISGTNSQLFSIPGLLALLVMQRSKLIARHYIAIAILLLVSLLAKEAGFLYFLIVLVFSILFKKEYFKKLLFFESIAFVFYLFIRFVVGKANFHEFFLLADHETSIKFIPIANLPLHEKMLNVPEIIFYYIKTFIYPAQLAVSQIWTISLDNSFNIYFPLIIVVLIFMMLITVAVYLFKLKTKTFKIYLFFLSWFCLGMGFHLPIFSTTYMTVADRWFYFSIIGMLGMIGTVFPLFFKSFRARKVGIVCAVIIIIIFSIRTIVRNTNFANNLILYSHDSKLQSNYMMEQDLGEEYLAAGNAQAALIHLQNANNWHRSARSLYDLGFWNEYQGNISQAIDYYSQAFNLIKTTQAKPNRQVYERLSYTLILSDNFERAKNVTRDGLKYFPQSDILWNSEAIIQYKLHNQSAALSAIEKAIELKPLQEYNDLYQIIITQQPLSLGVWGSPTLMVQGLMCFSSIHGEIERFRVCKI